MESFQISLNAVLPLFIYMAVGYLAKMRNLLDDRDVARFNKVVFNVFLALSVFQAVYSSDLSTAVKPRLMLYTVLGVLAEFLFGLAVAKVTATRRNQKGVIIQGIFRSNFTLIGMSIASVLVPYEDIAPVAILGAVVIPEFNILAVIALSLYGGDNVRPKDVLLRIAKNPLILATAAGVLCLLLKLRFPESVEKAINAMAGAASPVMLFLLGAFFHFDTLAKFAKQITAVTAFKLIINPAVFLTAGYLLGFRGMEFAALISVFASSAAVSSFTMSQQMGGDADLAGDIVVMTSILSCFTLFFWCVLFRNLGAF